MDVTTKQIELVETSIFSVIRSVSHVSVCLWISHFPFANHIIRVGFIEKDGERKTRIVMTEYMLKIEIEIIMRFESE